MNRRKFLLSTASAVTASAFSLPYHVIDTHIHLFDPNRPSGIPWPPADDPIRSKPTYPQRFQNVARSNGVAGAIVVECSPRIEDNQWVLEVSKGNPNIVGVVGFLDAFEPGFATQLERFSSNPLFRGIRFGTLWGHNLGDHVNSSQFISNMKLLADANLSLDTANPNLDLLDDVLRLSAQVPSLRIIIDHLPKINIPEASQGRFEETLQEFTARKQIYVKVSAVLQRIEGQVSHDIETYRPRVDEIVGAFGEDRILFGSDWPNSEPLGSYGEVINIVRKYFSGKGQSVEQKYFRYNSIAAYGWMKP